MAEETNTQQVEIRDYAIDEYVPMEARYYGAKEMTSTWICANANPTTWYMGTILGALGLGGALLSAIIGNPLVYLILALVGIIGYKVASTNMGLCRVSFGIAGSKLPSFINALQFVGWCGVNTYIAATPLATLLCSIFGGDPHSPIMLIISVFIILLITTFVSVYGAKYIGKAQIVAVACLAILSVWIGIRIFSLVSFSDIWKWSITDNPANSGWSLSFGGGLDIILANGFAWVMCAADYTRYTTSKKSATVAPMIGATLGFLWFVLIGATGAIAVAVTNGGLFDPYSADLSYICSSLGMGSIANLLIVISTIAVNMINIYSGGFSTANISEKLPPKGSMIGLGILSMLLALTPLVLGSFLDTFQVFLARCSRRALRCLWWTIISSAARSTTSRSSTTKTAPTGTKTASTGRALSRGLPVRRSISRQSSFRACAIPSDRCSSASLPRASFTLSPRKRPISRKRQKRRIDYVLWSYCRQKYDSERRSARRSKRRLARLPRPHTL